MILDSNQTKSSNNSTKHFVYARLGANRRWWFPKAQRLGSLKSMDILKICSAPKKGRTNQPKSQHKNQGAAGVQTVTYSFFGSGGFVFFRFFAVFFFVKG